MDSSPVLRQQSQNKIRTHPKPSKLLSAPHPPNQDIENKNPGNSEIDKKAPVRAGVSRLPVLAKSLRLQTPSDFSQSHSRWEEKPLAGKTKKKKPCTRPIPFNLSQPKSSRMATENQQPLTVSQSRTGAHVANNVCNGRLKTQHINAKPTQHPVPLNSHVDSTKGSGKCNGKATEENVTSWYIYVFVGPLTFYSITGIFGHFGKYYYRISGPGAVISWSLFWLPGKLLRPTHGCIERSMKLMQFSPNSAALQSILQNEGVKVGGPVGATPLNSARPSGRGTSVYTAQRVPARKNHAEAPGGPAGSMKLVQFSPDSAALQSILQNEGVKVGGPVGATPLNSARPSGRGTSIYTVSGVLKDSPLKKWTPQRVRDTRHQPMSAMVDHIVQKTCSLSPAVAMLRKRLPPLEELRMDEEVATYTSASVLATPGFLPPRPRCGNPLASILHFEEASVSARSVFMLNKTTSTGHQSKTFKWQFILTK
uniref:Uncharacterized protein n=1 Tax=Dicentrarchus labrax TaxID=13489 RepID=A0A8C4F8Q9_DICLA